ncbi:MAG: glutathione S-transferase family protein [Betaproteobacteria bacterium]
MYRLHGFCQSGNTFKVALALRCMEQPWTPVFVDFFKGATRKDEWRRDVNEMGEAPVLEDADARVTQSGVILTYLARKHGRFGGRTEAESREVLRWLLFDNHKFTSYFATYRFLKAFGPSAPDTAVMAFLKGRVDAAYAIVDKHLADSVFMAGTEPTIADFSLCGYVYYPEEESGLQLMSRFPNVARWAERVRALPGWAHPYEILPGERIAPKW